MSENNAVIIGPSAEKLLIYWTDLPLTYPTIINLFDTDVRESILTELIEAARKEGRKIYLGDRKALFCIILLIAYIHLTRKNI